MSLGSLIHSQVLNDAVSNSIASGIVYAIAAGNDGLPAIGYVKIYFCIFGL